MKLEWEKIGRKSTGKLIFGFYVRSKKPKHEISGKRYINSNGIGPVMWLEELAYYVLDATGKYKEPRTRWSMEGRLG